MLEIQGVAQNYDWGKLGLDSKVAMLASKNGLVVDETKPYAELWMGTHPSAPSTIRDSNATLQSIINETTLSPHVYEKYKDLPFLLKVLSIRKALSIQAHPDKVLAAQLNETFPLIYRDANHKPYYSTDNREMAVALTKFEAFIGFKPLEEIQSNLDSYPELSSVVGATAVHFKAAVGTGDTLAKKAALKSLFGALQNCNQEEITKAIEILVKRLQNSDNSTDLLLLRLNDQFPADVGTFCALLLNYVVLLPGEAIFLAANEPHAYLSGDCVECMAASDNVVRSGLTPKFKDVSTLVSMLTYNYGKADDQILRGSPYMETHYTREYNPPIEEFSLLLTSLKAGQKEDFGGILGPSILICVEGEGDITASDDQIVQHASAGSIYFLSADVKLKMVGNSNENFTVYRAFCT